MKIYKYHLPLEDNPSVKMPTGAHILSIQMQDNRVQIWATVQLNTPFELRRFFIVGTGHDVPDAISKYLATVQDGAFAWHIFEDPRPAQFNDGE